MAEQRKSDIRHFRDLDVYRRAFDAAMKIFELTKAFPSDERFSMVDQPRGKELEYRIIAVNKVGDGEPSNTAMVVL